MNPNDLPDRIRQKVRVNPDTNCWEWTAYIDENKYGIVRYNGKMRKAHRVVFTMMVSDPGPLDLDHLCRVRHCVNPNHLEPVTRSVNVLRGSLPQLRRDSAGGQCTRGHEYTDENTYWWTSPAGVVKRRCRECSRINGRSRYARNQAIA